MVLTLYSGPNPNILKWGGLSQVAPQSVDEVALLSQIPGLNLTQFNNIGTFRPNVAQHIPKPSIRACRARNPVQLILTSIELLAT